MSDHLYADDLWWIDGKSLDYNVTLYIVDGDFLGEDGL